MPFPKIAAVATATPPHRFTQSQILTLAGYGDAERSGFFRRSDIDGRYLWIDPATFRPNESVDDPKGHHALAGDERRRHE